MRHILTGVVLCLAAAASVVVLLDRLGVAKPSIRDLAKRIEAIESAAGQSTPEDPPSSPRPAPGRRDAKTDPMSEIIALLSEIQGMMMDSERILRSDLRLIHEKLSQRIDALAGSSAPAAADPLAKEAVRQKLREMGVTVVEDQGRLEMSGEIIAPTHLLELAIVAVGGRAHEAVIMADITPSALKIGLEDIGLVQTQPDPETGAYPPDAKGAYIYVLWDGIRKPVQLADIILNLRTNTTMERGPWMFTGSRFFTDSRTWERQFAADIYKNLVAIDWRYSLEAILACPLEDGANDKIWTPHPDLCPPAGTKVRIFIANAPQPEWDKI